MLCLPVFVLVGCTILPEGSLLVNAKSGNPQAQYELGLIYQLGQSVPQNHAIAKKWYQKAALAGQPKAQTQLGILYKQGLGTPLDTLKARKWLERAVIQNDPLAQYHLGLLYKSGNSTPRNYTKARKLYLVAAQQGLAAAHYELGMMYSTGKGVTKSNVRALSFFYLAKANEDPKGDIGIEIIELQLTNQQINQAQQIATNFHRKYLAAKPFPITNNPSNRKLYTTKTNLVPKN